MKTLLERYAFVRDADGGSGGIGAGGDAGAGDPGAGGASPGAGAAADAGGSGAAAAAYRPEGLADQLYGKSDKETIDNLNKAVNGYRQRDSERVVPENADAYAQFDTAKLPDFMKQHVEHFAKDPAFKAASEAFLQAGVPVNAMHAGMTAAYQALNDAGMLEAPVNVAAERAKLLPESHRNASKAEQDAAIDARMQANEDFINLLSKPGADGKSRLSKEAGENALLMLMDTAAGNEFLELVRHSMTGGDRAQPLTGGSGSASQNAREALRARMAAPEMNPGHPKFNRAAYDELMADYAKHIGNTR